jgi:hypothetical protein
VRSAESGARVDHQLVGIVGAMRLTDKARESGAPLWSVPRGQLVSARGTLQTTAGQPFLLHLEGPHSEQQLWCRSAESLDAWLHWIRLNHPQAKVSRDPPVGAPAVATGPKRPVPSRLSTSFSHGSNGAAAGNGATSATKNPSTMTLRQRFQRGSSRLSVEDFHSSGEEGSSASTTPTVTPNLTRNATVAEGQQPPPPPIVIPPATARATPGTGSATNLIGGNSTGGSGFSDDASSAGSEKAGGRKKMFGWAKKLYDKAGDAVQRNSGAEKGGSDKRPLSLDVFATSLEDLMEEQAQVYPGLMVPVLMRFLADEIVRCGGHRTEGIFRISASHADVAEVVAVIKKARNFEYKLPPVDDPHIPAAVMKQWLRAMPVPVFRDYERCIEVSRLPNGSPEEREAYCGMVAALSEVHRCVVLFLIGFLTFVGEPANVAVTKMPLANLALVFVPSFVRCPTDDINTMLSNQPAEQKFVQTLVELGAQGVLGPLSVYTGDAKEPASVRTSGENPDPQP